MQIVIDIPKEMMSYINENEFNAISEAAYGSMAMLAIQNGTPLPKGHGELIDRNKIEYLKAIHDAKYEQISWSDAIKQIKYSAPTIIEADKVESEPQESEDNNTSCQG